MPTQAEQIQELRQRVRALENRQSKVIARLRWLVRFLQGLCTNGILPKRAAKQMAQAVRETDSDDS